MTTNKRDDNFMNESMDMRRFFLCLFKKVWLIALGAIIGAVLGAGIYTLYYSITDGETTYQMSTDYYITFNEDDYPHGMDFYNAYTWNEFVTDDIITDYALSLTSVVSKDDIKESVSSEMPSDYRVLKVKVTNTDTAKVEAINEAYKQAMPHFADEINELTSIVLWSCDDMTIVNEHNLAGHAALLGAILALIIFGFAWAIYYCMDDRIYVEKDWMRINSQIPFVGYDCEGYKEDTDTNAKKLFGANEVIRIDNVTDNLEASEVVIQIPWGKKHRTAVEYDINVLNKRGIKVLGVVLTDCDKRFLKCYYGLK